MIQTFAIPILALFLLVSVIYALGSGKFGRAQTQAWIDTTARFPFLNSLLNNAHGKIRAGAHYVEFGTLFFVLYWSYDTFFASGQFIFRPLPSLIIGILCVLTAILDELHQIQSGSRQFRREDVFHSTCGVCFAAWIVMMQTVIRGLA